MSLLLRVLRFMKYRNKGVTEVLVLEKNHLANVRFLAKFSQVRQQKIHDNIYE